MSGGEPDDEAKMVEAAHREYQHQRDCILEYLDDCGAVTENQASGGKLTDEDHFGSEFDTSTIVNATHSFLAVSDARMQAGSNAEKIALAELLTQYRRLLPISPLTTTLAQVAGRAAEVAEVRAVRIAEVRGAENARGGKAALDGARIDARRAIVGPMIAAARREAEAADKRFSFKLLLPKAAQALVAAGLLTQEDIERGEGLSEYMLRRDDKQILKR